MNGVPAIRAQVLVNGKYSATATIRAGLKPTNYAVMGTFQGKGLDTVAWVNVRRAAAHPYSSVTVSSRTVHAGQRITISGNAPRNARAGKWITLMSDAFAAKQGVNRIPAIRTQVLVNGKYSAHGHDRQGPAAHQLLGDGHLPGQGPGHRRLDHRPLTTHSRRPAPERRRPSRPPSH